MRLCCSRLGKDEEFWKESYQRYGDLVTLNKNHYMETKELKDNINKALDNFPDDVLEEVLEYLKSLTNKSRSDIVLSHNLGKILEEDKNLLMGLNLNTDNYDIVAKLPDSKTLKKSIQIKSISRLTPKIVILRDYQLILKFFFLKGLYFS